MKIVDAKVVGAKSFGDTAKVMVKVVEGAEDYVELFDFFDDEIHFSASEFIGLTREQAFELKRRKDQQYLQS